MRIILTIILACFLSNSAFAQSPSWAWATSGQNTKGNQDICVTHDISGNIYAAGIFGGSITFGDSTYVCLGKQCIYVTKQDREGRLIWSQTINGPEMHSVSSIAIDESGSLYVGGYTETDTPSATPLWKDLLIVKLTPNGAISWRRWYGSKYSDAITGMAVDSKNNLVFTGYFSNPYLDDSLVLGNIVLVGQGGDDIFLAKMDSSGTVFWAKDIGTKHDEAVYSLGLTKNDAMVVVANFTVSITLGNLPTIRSVSGIGVSGDYFVAEFDSTGNALWAQVIGGNSYPNSTNNGEVQCMKLTIDKNGNIYVGGNYATCYAKIGPFVLPEPFDNQFSYDMWFAKLNPDGTVQWAKRAGGIELDFLRGLATDNSGNLLITGEAGFQCVFDVDTAQVPLSASGYLFIVKYDSDGKFKWLKTNGGVKGAVGFGVTVSDDEVVVVGGFEDASLAFGKSVVYNSSLGNGFVAKLNKEGVGVPLTTAGQFSISPNPASNTLQLQTQQADQFTSYQVSNALGQKVGSGILKSQTQQSIGLPDLADGMYYFSLSGRVGGVTRKVSIQH
ncbi:MAG: T9SS type A sorting domain-containing protein [Chitinophagaceae bacterium]